MRTLTFALLSLALTARAADRLDVGRIEPEAAGMDRARLSAVPVRMKEYVDAGQTAGMVTIVARRGHVASFEAIGFQELETKKPMRKNTMFRVASMTKPVTCAGIMILADEGKISVVDEISKYLPQFRGLKVDACGARNGFGCDTTAASRPINIEDLMTHTSGLPGSPEVGEGEAKTLEDLVKISARTHLLFQPGSNWNYSNLGIDILGRIIEIVAKQPFDQFLRERIFEPLAMKDTYFFVPADKRDRIATLYKFADGRATRESAEWGAEKAIPSPAGGLVSTAEDMLRFNEMMRNKGTLDGHRVLSSAAAHLMTISHTGDLQAGWAPGMGHGYGYEVVRNTAGLFRYNSTGSFAKGGAYRTYEWVDPEKEISGVFLMQVDSGLGDWRPEINSLMQMSVAAIEK